MEDFQYRLIDNEFLKGYNLKFIPSRDGQAEDANQFNFSYKGDKFTVGTMQIPWNCSLILVYGIGTYAHISQAEVVELYKNFFEYICKVAEDEGYTKVMYTTSDDQSLIIQALKEAAFKSIEEYISRSTSSRINIWLYDIDSEYNNNDDDYDDYDED